MVQEEVTDTAICRVMRGYRNRAQPYNKLHAQVNNIFKIRKFERPFRTIFSIFFVYSLFATLDIELKHSYEAQNYLQSALKIFGKPVQFSAYMTQILSLIQ